MAGMAAGVAVIPHQNNYEWLQWRQCRRRWGYDVAGKDQPHQYMEIKKSPKAAVVEVGWSEKDTKHGFSIMHRRVLLTYDDILFYFLL